MSSGSYLQSAVAQKLQYYSTIERREDLCKMILLANPDTIAWALEILDGQYSSGKKSSRSKRRKQHKRTYTRYQRQNTNRQILRDRSYSADADYLSNDKEAMRSDLSGGFAYGNSINAMDMAIQTVLDRRLQSDVPVTPQLPSDIRKYYIKVTTGDRRGAGTRADVYVVLQGKKRRSDEIFLTDTLSGLRPFQRGQSDEFMIKTENVGQLTELGIGHDQEEKDFSWYLKSVEINSGSESWHIPCNQWMSGSLESKTTFRFLKVVNLTPDSTRSHRHRRSQGSSSPTTYASKSSRIGTESSAKPRKSSVRYAWNIEYTTGHSEGSSGRAVESSSDESVDSSDSSDSEITSVSVKYTTEEVIKGRIKNLEIELKQEREARSKVEQAHDDLQRKLEQLSEQLEEAGRASVTQIELNKRHKADYMKLCREHEESVMQSEASLSTLKKKHADMLNEMTDQIENVSGVKSKIDKQRAQLRIEVDDLSSQLEEVTKLKTLVESNSKSLEDIVSDSKLRIEEHIRTIDKLKTEKYKLANENMDLAHQLEEAENEVNDLTSFKSNLTSQCEELKKLVEKESKTKQSQAPQDTHHDLDRMREQVEREQGDKAELQHALSKANAEIASWRTKYETDVVQRIEELEEAKKKLVIRLQKAEEEKALAKCESLEKTKIRLSNDMEDLSINSEKRRIIELESELKQERRTRTKVEEDRDELERKFEQLRKPVEEADGTTFPQYMQSQALPLTRLDLGLMREQVEEEPKSNAELKRSLSKANAEVMRWKEKYESVVTQHSKEMEEAKKKHAIRLQMAEEETEKALAKCKSFEKIKNHLTNERENLTINRERGRIEELESELKQERRARTTIEQERDELQCKLSSKKKHDILTDQPTLHGLDLLSERIKREQEGNAKFQRTLSKPFIEEGSGITKYETDAIQRIEELEKAKKKLAIRLREAEEQTENALSKCETLEKNKIRLTNEMKDLTINHEKAIATIMDKRQRDFENDTASWKLGVQELQDELDSSQRYSAEMYDLKSSCEKMNEQMEIVNQRNKFLSDRIDELTITLDESEKARKKAELDCDELRNALEEIEEGKVVLLQSELTKVKANFDLRLQEKDEELDTMRENHASAIKSIQASLDDEIDKCSNVMHAMKKYEAQLSDLEMNLDQDNHNPAEQLKHVRRLQAGIKEMQYQMDECHGIHEWPREQYSHKARKLNMLNSELREVRSSLASNERARKIAEHKLLELTERVNKVSAQKSTLLNANRMLETEKKHIRRELAEALADGRNAKKAVREAAHLAEELRQEKQHVISVERIKKNLEVRVREMSIKLDKAEANTIKGGREALADLQMRIKDLEGKLDREQGRHAESTMSMRKMDRRLKELTFQADEDQKNQARMETKLKQYKKMIEEAEEQANENLAKYRKASRNLQEAKDRERECMNMH